MGNVISLHPTPSQRQLLAVYHEALVDGYNRTLDAGRYDSSTTQVAIGFLAGAVIALRLTGESAWASRFLLAGERMEQDWRRYKIEIPELCEGLRFALDNAARGPRLDRIVGGEGDSDGR